MQETTTEAGNASKKIERSAAYPAISLEEAVSFTTSVSKHFTASQTITRADIAAVLGLGVSSIIRDVAASNYYGLFNRQKDGYQITTLFKAIGNPLNEKEKRKCLIEAFQNPKLFKDLIVKFDGHAVPAELKTHLIRFHAISEKVAEEAAEVFIKSGRFCGVLNESNILNVNDSLLKLSDPNFQYAEVVQQDDRKSGNHSVIDITPQNSENKSNRLLPLKNQDEEQLRIRLSSNRYAYLNYPQDITAKDIEILKKQIEVLELTIS